MNQSNNKGEINDEVEKIILKIKSIQKVQKKTVKQIFPIENTDILNLLLMELSKLDKIDYEYQIMENNSIFVTVKIDPESMERIR